MARETLREKREREEAEKEAKRQQRIAERRLKSKSYQRRLEHEEEVKARRDDRQRRLEEKASSGDPFAQSTIRQQKRDNKNAIKRAKKWARRDALVLGENEDEYKDRLEQNVAREGYERGGIAGGQRAVRELEDRAIKREDNQIARAKRLEEIGKQKKQQYDTDVNNYIGYYNNNPEAVDNMLKEGTADLFEGLKEIEMRNLPEDERKIKEAQFLHSFNNNGDHNILKVAKTDGGYEVYTAKKDGADGAYVKHKVTLPMIDAMSKVKSERLKKQEALDAENKKRQSILDLAKRRADIGVEADKLKQENRNKVWNEQFGKKTKAKNDTIDKKFSNRLKELNIKQQDKEDLLKIKQVYDLEKYDVLNKYKKQLQQAKQNDKYKELYVKDEMKSIRDSKNRYDKLAKLKAEGKLSPQDEREMYKEALNASESILLLSKLHEGDADWWNKNKFRIKGAMETVNKLKALYGKDSEIDGEY